MVGSSKKRSRPSGNREPDPAASPSPLACKKSKREAPKYGSQEYWENRYRVQFQRLQGNGQTESSLKSTTPIDTAGDTKPQNIDGEMVDTLPYHPWYFSYEELRVLLLPLILGGRKESFEILDRSKDDETEGPSSDDQNDPKDNHPLKAPASHPDQSAAAENSEQDGDVGTDDASDGSASNDGQDSEQGDGEDDSAFYEEVDPEAGDSESEDEEEVSREGLARDGPISVLEVGCGDVPLSCGLWNELLRLQRETNGDLQSIVKRIVATDYSSVVIEAMRAQHCGADPKSHAVKDSERGILLSFETVDARQMPYADETFELILEKGVLDAMLSDVEHGCDNCVRIVQECTRVLAPGGVLVLCSHLNANTPKGIRWLEEVVFAGIGKLRSKVPWEIEVHGRDRSDTADEDASPGPALYIVHKGKPFPDQKISGTVPLKFFVY